MTDPSADSMKIFDCRPGRAPDDPGIHEIGGANKSSDPVQFYLTPPRRAVGHLHFGTAW
jgi:hypothetical protein